MKGLAVVILLILAILPNGRAQQASLDDQGEAAVKAGNLGMAVAILSHEIQLSPSDARAYYDRAYAYSIARDYDKALADCHAALDVNPNYARAYCMLGNVNWMIGKQEDAVNDYDEALHLDPKDADIWFNRGLYYLHKDNAKCVTDMTEALRLNPNYRDAFYNRGNAYFDQQHYAEAIQDFTDGLRLDPRYGNLYHQRGFAYLHTAQPDKAIGDFTNAIQFKPKSDVEYYARGYAYAETHDYQKAIADYTQAILLNPKNDGYYDQRAQAYVQLGDKELANADFNTATQIKAQAQRAN